MKRILVGLALIAAGFLGGLLAQPPQPPGGPGFRGPGGGPGFGPPPFAMGTVSQVQGNTIVVESSFGEQTFTRTVVITNQTQIQRSQPGTKADIKPNAYALIQGQPDPKSGWLHARTILVLPNLPQEAGMVIGRIYDVRNQGNQFGVSVPISVAPDAQIYKLTPVKASEIKQGERIMVRGRNDESGNLIAEQIILGELPRFGFGFGGRGPGMGGPGGFGGQRGIRQQGGQTSRARR
ncbi:hypothetical protein GG496_000024 [Candidatus Fervidibacteria bacterium JGI MDM2 JNZ-1-D12]